MIDTREDNKKRKNCSRTLILHHNVQSLKNKLLELTVLLQTDLKNVDILCFTEHWLKDDQFGLINIERFKLVSNFSRSINEHGESCIYVKEYVQTKELNYLQKLGKEKVFEMSVVELLNYKVVVVCIYRSPDGDFYKFLKKFRSSNPKSSAEKEKYNFMWRLEHKFFRRQDYKN
jgi:hypothetical protein